MSDQQQSLSSCANMFRITQQYLIEMQSAQRGVQGHAAKQAETKKVSAILQTLHCLQLQTHGCAPRVGG